MREILKNHPATKITAHIQANEFHFIGQCAYHRPERAHFYTTSKNRYFKGPNSYIEVIFKNFHLPSQILNVVMYILNVYIDSIYNL